MKIDPKHNVIPWDHTLAIGGITIDLLSPVEAESVQMPPADQVTRVDLERAVQGLVPADMRPMIANLELSAGTLAEILGWYQACARVWSEARQQLCELLARRELQPVAQNLARQLATPAPSATRAAAGAKPAESAASRAQRQAASGDAIKFDVRPGGALPQVLHAEHERTLRIEQAEAKAKEIVDGVKRAVYGTSTEDQQGVDAASTARQSPIDGTSTTDASETAAPAETN